MTSLLAFVAYLISIAIVPLLLVGVICQVKAKMQNRVGFPVLQPFFDAAKLLGKAETISGTASWVFIWAPRVVLSLSVLAAVLVPWSGLVLPLELSGASDLILVIYLLGLARFFSLLAAMDTGSAFGGLGASREATLSVFAEPIMVLGLSALALGAGTTNLAEIFAAPLSPMVGVLVAVGLVVAALTELSRMPIDDPTTHLELTMVHEAMILENSGRNLALIEMAAALRTAVFLGLPIQTLLNLSTAYVQLPMPARFALGIAALFAAGSILAVAEGVLVKLNWRRVPNFLAFGTALCLLAALVAAARG